MPYRSFYSFAECLYAKCRHTESHGALSILRFYFIGLSHPIDGSTYPDYNMDQILFKKTFFVTVQLQTNCDDYSKGSLTEGEYSVQLTS
jgi:hypothetical protein